MATPTESTERVNRGESLPEELLRICEKLAEGTTPIAEVAASAGITDRELRRRFRQSLGVSPRQFQQSARLNRAKTELRGVQGTLDAVFAAGYGSVRGLYEAGSDRLGMTPASFARKGKGLTLNVETTSHPLGLLLVAGTERGVSFVALGDARERLLDELRRDYPLASISEATEPRWMASVEEALRSPAAACELPLDIFATAFQAKVWDALRRIPPGHTRSYSGLASSLGQPSATRAVARACATNPVAILIPCHRVVGVTGALTGYRWGIARKEELLRLERQLHRAGE